jgi:hypothetical protein
MFVERSEEKILHLGSRSSYDDNIKTDLKELGWECADFIQVTTYRD